MIAGLEMLEVYRESREAPRVIRDRRTIHDDPAPVIDCVEYELMTVGGIGREVPAIGPDTSCAGARARRVEASRHRLHLVELRIRRDHRVGFDVTAPREVLDGVERSDDISAVAEAGLSFDLAYTSVLKRAIRTLWGTLDEMDLMWLPVVNDWRLNERHYGALQGLNKAETAAQYGDEQVLVWRRSYDTPPMPLEQNDPRTSFNDPRYANLQRSQIPLTECLKRLHQQSAQASASLFLPMATVCEP